MLTLAPRGADRVVRGYDGGPPLLYIQTYVYETGWSVSFMVCRGQMISHSRPEAASLRDESPSRDGLPRTATGISHSVKDPFATDRRPAYDIAGTPSR